MSELFPDATSPEPSARRIRTESMPMAAAEPEATIASPAVSAMVELTSVISDRGPAAFTAVPRFPCTPVLAMSTLAPDPETSTPVPSTLVSVEFEMFTSAFTAEITKPSLVRSTSCMRSKLNLPVELAMSTPRCPGPFPRMMTSEMLATPLLKPGPSPIPTREPTIWT